MSRFSLVLDGEKSGLTARAEVVQRDKKTFKTHLEPPWKLYVEAHRSSSSSLSLPNRRGPELGNFILSTLGADIQASGSIESCVSDRIQPVDSGRSTDSFLA